MTEVPPCDGPAEAKKKLQAGNKQAVLDDRNIACRETVWEQEINSGAR